MNNEVKTITGGQAFQLSAAIAQSLSKLHLPFETAQEYISNRRKREKLLRQFLNEPPPVQLSPQLHSSLEETGVKIEVGGRYREIINIVPLISPPAKIDLADITSESHLSRGEVGKVLRCNIRGESETLTTILREVLQYQGPDSRLVDMMEKRKVFWTIFQVLDLLRHIIDNSKDPLGLEEFKYPSEVYFPIVLKRTVAIPGYAATQMFEGGMLQVTWFEFRGAKQWHLSFNSMVTCMELETSWFHEGKTIFFLNDPRIDGK